MVPDVNVGKILVLTGKSFNLGKKTCMIVILQKSLSKYHPDATDIFNS